MEGRTLFIGGILPAILLGTGTVLMKLSVRSGISLPIYLVIVGATVFGYGTVAAVMTHSKTVSASSGLFAFCMGLTWATAILCMSYGISILKLPVSVIAPLTNSNALVAVLLSALLFSELQNLSFPKVFAGTILIVVGAVVLSTSLQA